MHTICNVHPGGTAWILLVTTSFQLISSAAKTLNEYSKLPTICDRMLCAVRITRVLEGAISSNMFFRTQYSHPGLVWLSLQSARRRGARDNRSQSISLGKRRIFGTTPLGCYLAIVMSLSCVIPNQVAWQNLPKPAVSRSSMVAMDPNEHPSQALLDLYTMRDELAGNGRSLDGLRIALIGDLKYGRAVHSLCKLLSLFDNVSLHFVSPPELEIPADIAADLIASKHSVETFHSLEAGIHGRGYPLCNAHVRKSVSRRKARQINTGACFGSTRPYIPNTVSPTQS